MNDSNVDGTSWSINKSTSSVADLLGELSEELEEDKRAMERSKNVSSSLINGTEDSGSVVSLISRLEMFVNSLKLTKILMREMTILNTSMRFERLILYDLIDVFKSLIYAPL